MIVCSCNVLTDHDIRIVVTASREQPLSALQVYGCLGCSIRCGRCAQAIKRIITEASIACAYCSAVRGAV
jgi:bacterioferritin-associated ferredoxin